MTSFCKKPLFVILPVLMAQTALAETTDTDVDLGVLSVTIATPPTATVATQVITSDDINRQMATDQRDLVRYETGVTVVETGRMGASGYAIRGVDENRVAISVDGLRQAETLSSQGFKELFEGYGNFNNTRNSVELENVKRATIKKGAGSAVTGSGALGGAVLFETKEAKDFLQEKDHHIGYKTGYASATGQRVSSLTLAGRIDKLDALFIATRRDGHELKNYGYDSVYETQEQDWSAVGAKRQKADPYHLNSKSDLFKLGFEPNDNHRFQIAFDDTTLNSNGQDLSYVLRSGGQYSATTTEGQRLTSDSSKRRNVQFSYTYAKPTLLWDDVNISTSQQKITNKARTDEHCFRDNCPNVLNPSGLTLVEKDGVYVVQDGQGNELNVQGVPGRYSSRLTLKVTDSAGQEIQKPRVTTIIDCTKLNCNNKIRVVAEQNAEGKPFFGFIDKDITTEMVDGKPYGRIVPDGKYEPTAWGTTSFVGESFYLPMPRSSGYQENQYKDRDLHTDTKQVRLDFNKRFTTDNTSHRLSYGALFDRTNKAMVNEDGYDGKNTRWWADNFVCGKFEAGEYVIKPDRFPNCQLKSLVGSRDSYLIPVKTDNKSAYFTYKATLTKYAGVDLGYRYDKVKLTPSYDDSVPVPKGLIAGTFIPIPGRWYGENAPCGYHSDCMNKNLAQNLAIILQDRQFKHHSYNVGLSLHPTSFLTLQGKYANGFRAPTSDEMYMTFKHPSFSIQPNVLLKPEIAKTKELAVTLHKDNSFLTLSGFKTNYRDFLDLAYVGERAIDVGSVINYPFYRNVNRHSAKTTGVEVDSRLALGQYHLGYKLTRQKGRMDSDEGVIPMNAIQPTTQVYNLGYASANGKLGLDLYATHVAAKKAKDTYNANWAGWARSGKIVNGNPVTDNTLAWRNSAYLTWDLIAHYAPVKNLTLSAGVFNLTNKKYLTWDSARSIRGTGTTNLIDQATGEGINRFYAPERNYRVSAEIRF